MISMRPLLPILAAALLALGCAPNISRLRAHVAGDAFDQALEEARGDRDLEDHLAALILEKDAVERPSNRLATVRFLAASSAPGKRALERMEKREGSIAALAAIGLSRSSRPSGGDLDSYLEDLSSDVRAYAASTWARKLDVERLRRLALDKDPRVRNAAVAALGARRGDDEAGLLVEVLRLDPDPAVRSAAARSGKSLGRRAFEVLRSALDDRSEGVRHAALAGLAGLGSADAIALLEDRIAGAMDESGVVAAARLAAIGSKKGAARFEEALVDPAENMRATALVHLSTSGLGDALERRRKALEDESPRIVLIAASMLLDDEEGREAMSTALRKIVEEGGPRRDEAEDMLAVLGEEAALDEIRSSIAEWSEEEILARFPRLQRSEKLRDVFVELLADGRTEVRLAAARCVLRSGPT